MLTGQLLIKVTYMKTLLAAFAVMGAGFAGAQVISTTTPNNGSGGVFLHLTPATQPLLMTAFQTYFGSASGSPVSVEVWTRPGAYAGFTASNAGWTLHETVAGTSAGTTGLSDPLTLATPLLIPLGGPTSVYLHSITTGGGIRYTGTSAIPPQTTWSNSDVTLFSDVARTGAVPFAGSQFTPRTFAGSIHYQPVPEPGTMAAIGLGLAAIIGRRRHKKQ
jgi:hypothetical protein